MFPQFVKSGNFPRFIIDEKNVKFTTYSKNGIMTVKSNNFRMFISENQKYLYVAVTKNHCISIAVDDNVVTMTLSGVKNAMHTLPNFSSMTYSPLLYLVLFIYDLYRAKYTNLMWYLRKTLPNKPFNTHAVFYDEPFLLYVEATNRYALTECCKMYNCVLDGDSLFPREMFEFPAYKIRDLNDLHEYNNKRNEFNKLDLENEELVRCGNIDSVFSYIYICNYYILFEYAVKYNRVDIATSLCIRNFLDRKKLLKIVKEWPFNDVVSFVYSLQ